MHSAFLLLLCIAPVFSYNKRDVTFLMRDFILSENKPLKVASFLCWDKVDSLRLLKTFQEVNIPSTVLNFEILPSYTAAMQQLFILDLDCQDSEQLLTKAKGRGLLKYPFKWLILTKQDVFASTSILNKLEFRADSLFYIIESLKEEYKLQALYKVNKTGNLLKNDIGVWKTVGGFEYLNRFSISKNRTNLFRTHLVISHVITDLDSLNHLWDYRNKHVDTVTKVNHLLVQILTDMLNTTKTFIHANSWGFSNGTHFDGMMGHIQRGMADIPGSVLLVSDDRLKLVELIADTTPTRLRFILRNPPLSYIKNVYTTTFDSLVWFSSFGLLLISTLVLYMVARTERTYKHRLKATNVTQSQLDASFSDIVIFEVGQICQQGADTEPRSIAGRTAVIFLLISLMFIYTLYSANIVALLQSKSESIKTAEDLLKSRIKVGIENTSYNRFFFSVLKNPVSQALYQQKIVQGGLDAIVTIEEGIAKMRDEFYAFNVEVGRGYMIVGDTFQEHEKCGLTEIKVLEVGDPWFALPRNSPYKEQIKVAVKQLLESGIPRCQHSRLYPKKPACKGVGSNFVSVGLIDCYFAFLLFVSGVFASLGLLILEIFVFKYQELSKTARIPCN